VASVERDAYLAVVLHPADAGAVAGARIDDHERRLRGVDLGSLGRDDPHQAIVGRPGHCPTVADELRLEFERVRNGLLALLEVTVAALSEGVEEQDRALPGVEPVLLNGSRNRGGHRNCSCVHERKHMQIRHRTEP
jgi:hypothetical protein